MRIATLFLVLSFFPTHFCFAAFTDFSDFTQRTEFGVGDEFLSNGLSFRVTDLIPQLSTASVLLDRLFPDPSFAVAAVGPGVEFLLPDNTQEVSFSYENGGGWSIYINGVKPSFSTNVYAKPRFLDGMSVAGVAISVDPMNTPHLCSECGILTLRGPITSFAIAGVEMFIDDVSVIVPEPSTAALLLAAGVSLLTRRRRV